MKENKPKAPAKKQKKAGAAAKVKAPAAPAERLTLDKIRQLKQKVGRE